MGSIGADVMEKKVLMVVPHQNFRDEECFVPKEFFEGKGYGVTVASTEKGEATGVQGGTVEATLSLDEADAAGYDAIVFVGGPGTPSVRSSDKALEICRAAVENGKVLAAICWAPTILAKAGVLEGKKSSVWLGNDPEYGMGTNQVLEKYGATHVNEGVVVDGKIITADGPAHAAEFAEEIAKLVG